MRTWSLRLLSQLLGLALSALHVLAAAASGAVKSRATLQLENLALRHQLGILPCGQNIQVNRVSL